MFARVRKGHSHIYNMIPEVFSLCPNVCFNFQGGISKMFCFVLPLLFILESCIALWLIGVVFLLSTHRYIYFFAPPITSGENDSTASLSCQQVQTGIWWNRGGIFDLGRVLRDSCFGFKVSHASRASVVETPLGRGATLRIVHRFLKRFNQITSWCSFAEVWPTYYADLEQERLLSKSTLPFFSSVSGVVQLYFGKHIGFSANPETQGAQPSTQDVDGS